MKNEIYEQINEEKNQYKEIFKLVKTISLKEDEVENRFYKNKAGYWLPYKKGCNINGQLDIINYDDGYLYFIQENSYNYLIYSKVLYTDFNKPTNMFGNECPFSDLTYRIKTNLKGYYYEINDLDKNNVCKYEYFQNSNGNIYLSSLKQIPNMLICITNYTNHTIMKPKKLEKKDNVIICYLGDYYNTRNINNEILDILYKDVKETNKKDLDKIKRIFE